MTFRPPTGISDFRDLRRSDATYVDKTGFVTDVLAQWAKVLLLPRPRRFGKTLNLSALRYFLERSEEDRSDLFEGLAVWESEAARAHFQRYPVVFLTFKDVKYATWEACLDAVRGVMAGAYAEHRALLDGGGLDEFDSEHFRAILGRRAGLAELAETLRRLSSLLHERYGEPVVLLIDEYDTPLHAAFVHGYYEEAVAFFRNLLSGGLKDNSDLFRGVVTGILRVARESIFSGLNNLEVHSLLSRRFATAFGFVEGEVERLAELAGAADRLGEVRDWYDGYVFGGEVVYNPWSVVSFLAAPDAGCRPYWSRTSSNDLLYRLLTAGGLGEPGDLEVLLSGGEVERTIEENVVFHDLDRRPDAVWSLLLFSGYLKATDARLEDGRDRAGLSIPNREVRTVWETVFRDWLQAGLGTDAAIRELLAALLAGDAGTFGRLLSDLLRTAMSFHDFGGPRPERVYHAFIAGLLVQLASDYEVRSNRESGYGRYDVMVLPRRPGRAGVVVELKVLDEGETVEGSLEAALRQVRERDYATELRARGADPVRELAVVFDGKRAWAEAVSEERFLAAAGCGREPDERRDVARRHDRHVYGDGG